MKIIRAEIVGTRMAEEGSGGYTVNSTSYSVLLFYDNGDVNLVEGDAKDIKPYLRYIQPQNDMTQLQSLLEKIEEKLKRDFDKIIEKNIEKVYDNVKIDEYIIMPNHIHIILKINYLEINIEI